MQSLLTLISLVFFFVTSPALAQWEWDATYKARVGYHLTDPKDLAMHRHSLELRTTAGPPEGWGFAAGARAYIDSAFSGNSRYNGQPVERLETSEFAVRDLYLQYKRRRFQLRFGNQQLVWGEAFGFFFADIINPKDTREFGLGGDLTAQRITIPMATAIFFFPKGSLQFVYIPKPIFNLVPAIGSDFSARLDTLIPSVPTSVTAPRSLPLELQNGEFGMRVGSVLVGWDLAFFFLTYFDRAPVYDLDLNPTQATFIQTHPKLTTVGLTGTKDLESWLVRFEALYTRNRPINTFNLNLLNLSQSLQTVHTDEWVGVLGIDYTHFRSWRVGAQVSNHLLAEAFTGSFVPTHRTQISVSLYGPLYKEQAIDIIWSYFVQDGSQLLQASYHIPLTDSAELSIGSYAFFGGENSQYGRFKAATRGTAQLVVHFGG